jgi:ABC-type sugar transport system ATPase subunit
MARVVYEDVCKRFGDVVALENFTLDVEDGEFVVFVGPSGSGKTTALRTLAGLESISSGHVQIGERVVDDLPPRDRDIAMVFQNYALYPHMTVYENLAYGLRMRKMERGKIKRRVAEAADALGLGELLKRKPRELSGGQRQRVALGRALVREPEVFLMDEPLSNLDAKLRVQTRGEIKRLQQQVGTTTVYVTHDQVEAMTMGDRIVVMDRGVIEQVGSPAIVYNRPANVFVAGFIGSPAMTFGHFSAEEQNGSLVLTRGHVRLKLAAGGLAPSKVIAGVRPEHTRIWSEGRGLLGPLEGTVEFVEALGRETFVGVALAEETRFIVEVEGQSTVQLGDTLRFGFDRDKIHLFDPESGESLARA